MFSLHVIARHSLDVAGGQSVVTMIDMHLPVFCRRRTGVPT
jgi:hypothetical protein